MSPVLMHQFWSLVETTGANIPFSMDDRSLVQWFLRQVGSKRSLNRLESDVLCDYIQTRLPLIRDLAQEQLSF